MIVNKAAKAAMVEEDAGWKQHYPTYSFKNQQIAIEEYKSAAAVAAAEERLFTQSVNVAVVVAAALGSLGLGGLHRLIELFSPHIESEFVVTVLLGLFLIFSFSTLRYFSHRQREMIFAKRKMVVLRRMLGLDYGSIQLVLPNWRIEGANQPFALKLFPGWGTYVAYPFWLLGTFSAAVLFMFGILLVGFTFERIDSPNTSPVLPVALASIWWLGFLAFQYRKSLYDVHETSRLSEARVLARAIGLKLVPDFEYVLYRAKLAAHETKRVGIDTSAVLPILVFFEDREFYTHSGISFKGIARACLSLVGARKRSGGSTITMQLARTLFVREYSKTLRRKVVELELAPWLESILSKDDIIQVYLSAVRFAPRVIGLPAAMLHYFGDGCRSPTAAEATILVERLSSVQGKLDVNRFGEIASKAVQAGVLDAVMVSDSLQCFERLAKTDKVLIADRSEFEYLKSKWAEVVVRSQSS